VSWAEYDDVVQALTPDRANEAFCIRILPRRTIRRKNFPYPQCRCPPGELLPVDGITITDQRLWCFVYAAGLDKLLCSPGSGRMIGYIQMQDPTTVITENDENKQDFEAGCSNRKEIK